ncbi:NAD-dependent epimerase/dehydratase family protein [Nocardia wallacei]|uniref:NAD-dependent epimerase/dehydratase family protein n=1 Tax=Nocardia wallacei TaxID=480035 RepID=UPI00245721DB|nr:NAD(P)-dependent oxidoreductase [Nocardia wallacei]
MTLLITGAAGTIGTHLATTLTDHGIPLRMLDRRPLPRPPAGAETIQADLRDLPAVEQAAAGTSAIIHLAGITQEGPFTEMIDHNITATHHVLEAARRQHVPRVVLASSHHVTGLTPIDGPASPLAPDSFYAVSKVTTEALGYLYAHKTALTVVAIRIGSYRPQPSEPRHHATWLSPRDATTLLYNAATHPIPEPFLTIYGTSDTHETWWPRTGWDTLDYQPADRTDQHTTVEPLPDRFVGGVFAEHDLPAS